MRKWMLATGLFAILVYVGNQYTRAKPSDQSPFTATVELPEEKLNRVANDSTVNRAERAAAVFALFQQFIKPGDSLRQVRSVLRNTAWVGEAHLSYFLMLSGWIPVDMNFKDRTYCLQLFADNQGNSEWVIYFQLAGDSEFNKWDEDGIAFLCGKVGSKGESRIKEFALCYPKGEIAFFKKR